MTKDGGFQRSLILVILIFFSISHYSALSSAQSQNDQIIFSTYFGGPLNDSLWSVDSAYDRANIIMLGHGYRLEDTWQTVKHISSQEVLEDDYTDLVVRQYSANGIFLSQVIIAGSGEDRAGTVIKTGSETIIAGISWSPDFPVIGSNYNASQGIFVTKLSSVNEILWSTHIGVSGIASFGGAVMDQDRNIIVVGNTQSSDFPIVNGTEKEPDSEDPDGIICKFSSEGNLIWSTYFGGSSYELGTKITVDFDNSIYITGTTLSSDFPGNENPSNSLDLFLVKYSSAGELLWSTVWGGRSNEQPTAISIDGDQVYVTGLTNSPDFPSTMKDQQNEGIKSFLSAFSHDGGEAWHTFVGDEEFTVTSMDCGLYDCNLAGYYSSQNENSGLNGYITNFNRNGENTGSISFGGSSDDLALGIRVTDIGLIVVGSTTSDDFPRTDDVQSTTQDSDMFLAIIEDDFVIPEPSTETETVSSRFKVEFILLPTISLSLSLIMIYRRRKETRYSPPS